MSAPDAAEGILRSARTIAVLGIKPETRPESAAYYIPLYLSQVGYEIIPVPVRFFEHPAILGRAVVRDLRAISPPPDILSVFRPSDQFPAHLPDILALHPPVVWFQSGLLHAESAETLRAAGIQVVHDCIGCRRAAIAPSTAPLTRR